MYFLCYTVVTVNKKKMVEYENNNTPFLEKNLVRNTSVCQKLI